MPISNKNALNHTVHGILRAYKAIPDKGKEMVEIWNSADGIDVSKRPHCKDKPSVTGDNFEFAKFVAPTVAEGKVYLATFSSRLAVYGLRSGAPVSAARRTRRRH
jgi:hypothetical protein